MSNNKKGGVEMSVDLLIDNFKQLEPILKQELKELLGIKNNNTLNQRISTLITFGIIKLYQNGIYCIPSSNKRFSHLKPLYKK